MVEGTFDTYHALSHCVFKSILFHLKLSFLPLTFRLVLLIGGLMALSQQELGGFHLIIGLVVGIFLFLPMFFFSASIFFVTERGATVFGYLSSFLFVFSGGYFPVEAFPQDIVLMVKGINIFEIFLRDFRYSVLNSELSFGWDIFLPSLVLLPSSIFSFKLALRKFKKQGGVRVYLS